ncbi:glycosyltransferase family 39 protein [Aquimarina sp. M1]
MRLLDIGKYKDQIMLLVLWMLLILIINPIGDFPLNDDWCYAKSVKTLLEEGYLKLYNWGEMTLVGHVYWGYFFTKIFGFSFTVLRWSTLIMGFATILGIYELCKLVKMSRWMSLFATVLCMMNPIFLSLSFSFMTDVPFYCLLVWAFYFFVMAIQTDRWQPLFMAIFVCCWAFLIRQLVLIFPLVWFITMVAVKKKSIRNWIKAIMPGLVIICFYFLFSYVMESQGLLQERYNSKFNDLIRKTIHVDVRLFLGIFSYILISLSYIGFLLSPIHIYYIVNNKIKGYKIWMLLYTFLITGLLIKFGKTIPSLHNIWIDFGVGPTTLTDYSADYTLSPSPTAPMFFWWIVTGIGVLSSISLFFRLKSIIENKIKNKVVHPEVLFSLVFMMIYLIPFLIVGLYDRYLLPLFPIIIIFLHAYDQTVPNRLFKYFAVGFLGLMSLFSICATHDYLSWNRVRWNTINALIDSGVTVDKIQGGVEFVTWYHFSETKQRWWEDVTPVYSLVFSQDTGNPIFKELTYNRWLPGKGVMYVTYCASLEEE